MYIASKKKQLGTRLGSSRQIIVWPALVLFGFIFFQQCVFLYQTDLLSFISINTEVIRSSSEEPQPKEWGLNTYLRLALSGPRKCQGASCYIVDVIADPYQPRIFLSMLGLPASDLGAKKGSTTNITMVDVRSGQEFIMLHSTDLVNTTHGYTIVLRGDSNDISFRLQSATCKNLKHQGNTALNAYYESMTWACDLNPQQLRLGKWKEMEKVYVDVLLGPSDMDFDNNTNRETPSYLNLTANKPFDISKSHGLSSSGLFNSASRRGFTPPQPFLWKDGNSNEIGEKKSKKLRVSACIIGVDYYSVQLQDVIQAHITMGFEHVYLAVPQWPTSASFNQTWNLLSDFVKDGSLSIIVSEYTTEYIQPTWFKKNFTYAPQGHKTSFLNTCLLVARAAGDDMTFVGDSDELIEYKYGDQTSVAHMIEDQLLTRNISLEDTCAITLSSLTALYSVDKAGFSNKDKIADKIAGIKSGTDSVNTYGKSIENVRRILRAGLHSPAYCEDNPSPETRYITRPSNISMNINAFRPNISDARTLHLSDSYSLRSRPWELKVAAEEKHISYYVRDWSSLVQTNLGKEGEGKPRAS